MLKFSKTELFVRNTHSQLDFSSFEYQIIIFFHPPSTEACLDQSQFNVTYAGTSTPSVLHRPLLGKEADDR